MSNNYLSGLINRNREISFNLLVAVFLLVVVIPFCLIFLFKCKLPIYFYLLLFAVSRAIYVVAKIFNQRASKAKLGLEAEEIVDKSLKKLPALWTFERNIILDKAGDVDFLVISPDRTCYLIEVKSHYGEIITENNTLKRKSGSKIKNFEKDIIRQVNIQLEKLKKQRNFSKIIPIILFTNAKILANPREINSIKLLELSELNDFLINNI